MKFLWLLFWDPAKALDLYGPNGKIAHSKVLGLFAFLTLYPLAWYEVAHRSNGALDWVKWSILFAAPFGLIGLRTWFASKVAQRREHFTAPPVDPTEPNLWTDNEQGDGA
jgi:hypothetical protein